MSNHEAGNGLGYQPDLPFSELDDRMKTVIAAMADGSESPERLLVEFALLDRILLRAIDAAPALDFPPGLPAKLLELWAEEDRLNGTPPTTPPSPDTQQ